MSLIFVFFAGRTANSVSAFVLCAHYLHGESQIRLRMEHDGRDLWFSVWFIYFNYLLNQIKIITVNEYINSNNNYK